jgi:hypothetical protein
MQLRRRLRRCAATTVAPCIRIQRRSTREDIRMMNVASTEFLVAVLAEHHSTASRTAIIGGHCAQSGIVIRGQDQ